MLSEFIEVHRDEIIARCRTKVAKRSTPPPSDTEVEHGVPVFLDQLREALRLGATSHPEVSRVATQHGRDLHAQGFTVSQVVHDYGDVCQTVTELAVETNAPIPAEDFGTLNLCLDDAIAGAVSEYGRQRDASTLASEALRGTQRLGFLAHELRNVVNTAIVSFKVLQTGNVGVAGSTGLVLDRALMQIRTLVGRTLEEVRGSSSITARTGLEPFSVAAFIEEIREAASSDADAAGATLTMPPVETGVTIRADRTMLGSAVGNLLQNAIKFTRPGTTVTLRVVASPEHVRFEVEDECGGLPGEPEELFVAFNQAGEDRTGLGLGLTFTRWGVEADNGRVSARSLPGRGCIFTIELPRCPVAGAAP